MMTPVEVDREFATLPDGGAEDMAAADAFIARHKAVQIVDGQARCMCGAGPCKDLIVNCWGTPIEWIDETEFCPWCEHSTEGQADGTLHYEGCTRPR